MASSSSTTNTSWNCPQCTFTNHELVQSCELCECPRSEAFFSAEPIRRDRHSGVDEMEYSCLLAAEHSPVVICTEQFDCPICVSPIESGCGVVLRGCLHTFCISCLEDYIANSESAVIKCPFNDGTYQCQSDIEDREIRALVSSNVFEKYLRLSNREAESQAGGNSFHCLTPDCPGWCLIEHLPPPPPAPSSADYVSSLPGIEVIFQCDVCRKVNCVICRAIHENETCQQYRQRQADKVTTSQNDKTAAQTEAELKRLLAAGEAMKCPKCSVIVEKTQGCDWLVCTYCKTELCWATKQARWGPNGRGDTSGGCRCDLAHGRPCHPKCGNCH